MVVVYTATVGGWWWCVQCAVGDGGGVYRVLWGMVVCVQCAVGDGGGVCIGCCG